MELVVCGVHKLGGEVAELFSNVSGVHVVDPSQAGHDFDKACEQAALKVQEPDEPLAAVGIVLARAEEGADGEGGAAQAQVDAEADVDAEQPTDDVVEGPLSGNEDNSGVGEIPDDEAGPASGEPRPKPGVQSARAAFDEVMTATERLRAQLDKTLGRPTPCLVLWWAPGAQAPLANKHRAAATLMGPAASLAAPFVLPLPRRYWALPSTALVPGLAERLKRDVLLPTQVAVLLDAHEQWRTRRGSSPAVTGESCLYHLLTAASFRFDVDNAMERLNHAATSYVLDHVRDPALPKEPLSANDEIRQALADIDEAATAAINRLAEDVDMLHGPLAQLVSAVRRVSAGETSYVRQAAWLARLRSEIPAWAESVLEELKVQWPAAFAAAPSIETLDEAIDGVAEIVRDLSAALKSAEQELRDVTAALAKIRDAIGQLRSGWFLFDPDRAIRRQLQAEARALEEQIPGLEAACAALREELRRPRLVHALLEATRSALSAEQGRLDRFRKDALDPGEPPPPPAPIPGAEEHIVDPDRIVERRLAERWTTRTPPFWVREILGTDTLNEFYPDQAEELIARIQSHAKAELEGCLDESFVEALELDRDEALRDILSQAIDDLRARIAHRPPPGQDEQLLIVAGQPSVEAATAAAAGIRAISIINDDANQLDLLHLQLGKRWPEPDEVQGDHQPPTAAPGAEVTS